MKSTIYIIEHSAYEWDDIFINNSHIVFVSDDKEKALAKFNDYKEFCLKTFGDTKWCYEYYLYEYYTTEKCRLVEKCANHTFS